MTTRVLVAYATHHGATRGIAERITARLHRSGLEADVRRVDEAGDIASYDAFVIGSAVYAFHWVKEANAFVRRQGSLLAAKPLWLFSSGPLASDDPEAAKADAVPREIAELMLRLKAREHCVFAGAYDPSARPIGLIERITRLMPAARDALPVGDFRDWDEIDAWADSIAGQLVERPIAVG